MVDLHNFIVTWVVMDDVIDRVKAEGLASDSMVKRRAQQIWVEFCFTLEVYHTAQGVEGTQAEFMCAWLWLGHSWAECKMLLTTLFRTSSSKRALPETFRADTMKRLRTNLDQTYKPVTREEAQTRGDAV